MPPSFPLRLLARQSSRTPRSLFSNKHFRLMSSSYQGELEAAIATVVRAGRMCQKIQAALIDADDSVSKKDKSPVTIGDYASQAVIIHDICTQFPHPIIAEESSKDLDPNSDLVRKAADFAVNAQPAMKTETFLELISRGANKTVPAGTKRWWTIDPIDGTLGFLRRGQYAVCLALIEDGVPVVGVLGCPNLCAQPLNEDGTVPAGAEVGILYYAAKGAGAHCMMFNGGMKPTKVSVAPQVATSQISHTTSFEERDAIRMRERVLEHLNVSKPALRVDSQVKYALVARGEASCYFRFSSDDHREKIWDHAAGQLIVEEAGGQVTDIRGRPLDFNCGHKLKNNVGIVASSGGQLQKEMLAAVDVIHPVA